MSDQADSSCRSHDIPLEEWDEKAKVLFTPGMIDLGLPYKGDDFDCLYRIGASCSHERESFAGI